MRILVGCEITYEFSHLGSTSRVISSRRAASTRLAEATTEVLASSAAAVGRIGVGNGTTLPAYRARSRLPLRGGPLDREDGDNGVVQVGQHQFNAAGTVDQMRGNPRFQECATGSMGQADGAALTATGR